MKKILVGLFVGLLSANAVPSSTDMLWISKAHAQSAEANCNFRWRVRAPTKTERINKGRINTKAGTPCTTKHIGWVGGNWQYHSISVRSQPDNGRLSKVGKFGIRFVPSAGAKGSSTADLIVNFRNVSTNEVFPNTVRITVRVK